MNLPSELVRQFVKITNDKPEPKKETTVYGTTVEHEGVTYVKLDGSELLTPVTSTASTKPGERVTVMIKNHTATITGNISSPSASSTELKSVADDTSDNARKITEFEIALGTKAEVEELKAETARINTLVAENISIKQNLVTANANIETLQTNEVTISKQLNANKATIETLQTTKLDAKIAEAKFANIDFSNIGKAAMEYFYSQSGLIKNVVVGDQTITGNLVGVTIKGDLIEGNTIKADRLVIKGTDGLYYKLNVSANTTEAEQTDENSLNGQIIKAKSITATKISVSDLVAFDATIGGFNITENSIYSGVKESVSNTTRGIYLDNDGQMSIGDSNNYIKYYKDPSTGQYRLDISVVEAMEIGNKNLLVNTYLFTQNSPIVLSSSKTDGHVALFNGLVIHTPNAIEPGANLTIQACTDAKWNNQHGYVDVTSKERVTIWLYWYSDIDECINNSGGYTHAQVFTDSEHSTGRHTWTLHAPTTSGIDNWYARVRLNTYSDGTEVVTHKFWNIKLENGHQASKWTPAPEDIRGASKTATDYLSFSANGLVVGDMIADTLGKNVLIDSDSVDIRDGDDVLASFGANKIVLGQNAEGSTIDLCDGAGSITALVSESADSKPRFDSLQFDSQKFVMRGKRIYNNAAGSNSAHENTADMEAISYVDSAGAAASLSAKTLLKSSKDVTSAGVQALTDADPAATRTRMYAEFEDASAGTATSNSVYVYPTITEFTKPISINGHIITGTNKILWSGASQMIASHTATLNQAISEQPNGIVLVFSEYIDGVVSNTAFHHRFIPKHQVANHGGSGCCIQLSSSNLAYFGTKYLYINNTTITGSDNNTLTGASTCGITRTCNRFCLRYVIGV